MKTLTLLLLTVCTAFAQGPLAPPTVSGPLAGPVPPVGAGGVPQPAMKTLHQIEPRTPLSGGVAAHVISAPGSYYLTGNVNQSGTNNAIRINAEDVTLDLNGFSVIGSFSGANLAGIYIETFAKNVVVKNGIVRNWSGHAINATAPRFSGEGLRLINNGLDGISTGSWAKIVDCHAMGNGNAGFLGFDNCVIRECSATENGVYGIRFMNQTVVQSCLLQGPQRGIVLANDGLVASCSVSGGTQFGISLDNSASVLDTKVDGVVAGSGIRILNGGNVQRCTVTNCTGDYGIYAGSSSHVANCLVKSCTVTNGIIVFYRSSVIQCVASENTSANASQSCGIYAESTCLVSRCDASGNTSTAATLTEKTGAGIITFFESTVDGCVAGRNKGAGIVCTTESVITNNHCTSNGGGVPAGVGPGIFGVSIGNRIDHNHVYSNTHGIKLLTTGNLVTGNVSRSNAWSIVAGNRVAPLVPPPTTAAITGTTGGTAFGSTDPTANFMY
ncbi:MAG: right-handed parallel beta-helix repeat-containing protein [Verrucomicrobiota bacterium]